MFALRMHHFVAASPAPDPPVRTPRQRRAMSRISVQEGLCARKGGAQTVATRIREVDVQIWMKCYFCVETVLEGTLRTLEEVWEARSGERSGEGGMIVVSGTR